MPSLCHLSCPSGNRSFFPQVITQFDSTGVLEAPILALAGGGVVEGLGGVGQDLAVKNPPAVQETQEKGFNPWVRKIPWRRAWQPTLVFLPGESHGQRSLAGYSPWSQKVPRD